MEGGPGQPASDAQDLQAIAETLRGDRDAFRAIVERHGGLILRLARSFLRSREEAEEACQEIFFKAFRNLRSFRLERPFLPWLYSIALNHLRTRYVGNQRREARVVRTNAEKLNSALPHGDPSSVVEKEETRDELRRAVAALPRGLRDAVVLYYLEAMNISQVSAVLGIGTENVKSRLLRGRRRLREILGQDATP